MKIKSEEGSVSTAQDILRKSTDFFEEDYRAM